MVVLHREFLKKHIKLFQTKLVFANNSKRGDDETEGCRCEAILYATRFRVLLGSGPCVNAAMPH